MLVNSLLTLLDYDMQCIISVVWLCQSCSIRHILVVSRHLLFILLLSKSDNNNHLLMIVVDGFYQKFYSSLIKQCINLLCRQYLKSQYSKENNLLYVCVLMCFRDVETCRLTDLSFLLAFAFLFAAANKFTHLLTYLFNFLLLSSASLHRTPICRMSLPNNVVI